MLTHTVLLLALAVCSLASSSTPERFEQVRRRDSTFVAREHHPDLLQKRHRKPLAKRACKSKSRQSSSTAQTSSAVPSQATSSVSASNKNVNTESSSSGSSGSSSNSTSSSSDDSSTSSVGLPSGITHFTGQNSGIGSWFRTNNGGDDTNGRSWCQLNYQDDWLGFAPDVTAMLSDFGNDISKAGGAYCGLEAKATNPETGATALIYIVDGFDSKWVKTPQSIDLTLGAFKALYGSTTDDKNVVIKDLQWEFTGNKKAEYSFNAGGK